MSDRPKCIDEACTAAFKVQKKSKRNRQKEKYLTE